MRGGGGERESHLVRAHIARNRLAPRRAAGEGRPGQVNMAVGREADAEGAAEEEAHVVAPLIAAVVRHRCRRGVRRSNLRTHGPRQRAGLSAGSVNLLHPPCVSNQDCEVRV